MEQIKLKKLPPGVMIASRLKTRVRRVFGGWIVIVPPIDVCENIDEVLAHDCSNKAALALRRNLNEQYNNDAFAGMPM